MVQNCCNIKNCTFERKYGYKCCSEHYCEDMKCKRNDCHTPKYKNGLCRKHNPQKIISTCSVCNVTSTTKLLGGRKCKRCTRKSTCSVPGCTRPPSIRNNHKTKIEVRPGKFECINDGQCFVHNAIMRAEYL